MYSTIRQIAHDLRPVRRPARLLYRGALFWLASGLFHIGVLAADGWTWSGAVSFRKPITFSLSIGLLLGTVGWILDRLSDRPRRAGAIAWTFLVSSTIEVGLITLQTWRGRPSHFNIFEAGDAVIFGLMGAMVGLMSLSLLAVLAWAMVDRPVDPLVRVAVIGGLLMVATGLGIGQWIIGLGTEYAATHGLVPDTVTYGSDGVAKFPHAVAFHGIQVLIVSAVILRRGTIIEAVRKRLMWMISLSYAAALVLASVQTVLGLAPSDPSPWSLSLAGAVAIMAAAIVRAVKGLDFAANDRRTTSAVA